MGGSALLIHGELEPARRTPPRGFFARLFWRSAARETALSGGTFIDLPPGPLKELARDFRDFLARELPAPWPATKAVFDYLDLRVTDVYLRGQREGDAEPAFYVQVGFSGCAGQAQVSADLAAHWAQAWFERERERIEARWLRPAGFTAARAEPVAEADRFLPIGDAGYAAFSPEAFDDGGDAPVHFTVDVAVHETDEAHAATLLQALEARFAAAMRDGRCRCQLCAPDFDFTTITFPAAV